MNTANHRAGNLENPRKVFLICVVGFLFGDILGIQELFTAFGGGVVILVLYIGIKRSTFWVCLFMFLSYMIGFLLGRESYLEKGEDYKKIVDLTHGFSEKGSIVGSIEKIIYRKERSTVYLFNIDNFDNFDKNTKNPLEESQTSVNLVRKGRFGEKSKKTIFIDIPSNLTLTPGDIISFEGTIKPNIHFPLVGYDRYAFFHGGYGYLFVTNFRSLFDQNPGFIYNLHEKWEKIFTTSFPRDVAGIVLGMTIGSTKYLTGNIKDAFLSSGITHILVVSGSNIAFLILFLTFFIKYIHTSRWMNIVLIIASVLLYVGIVGIEVPVIRAAMMGIISFLIATAGLKASGRAIIGLTLILLTIIEPLSPLFDAGYGLSFGATLGILLFQKHTEHFFIRFHIPKILGSALALTIGASLGSLPIMLYHFGNVAVNSIITNILIAGFLGSILFSSTIFGILSLFGFPFLKVFGLFVYVPTKIIISISQFLSNGIQLTLNQEQGNAISIFLLGYILYYYIFGEETV